MKNLYDFNLARSKSSQFPEGFDKIIFKLEHQPLMLDQICAYFTMTKVYNLDALGIKMPCCVSEICRDKNGMCFYAAFVKVSTISSQQYCFQGGASFTGFPSEDDLMSMAAKVFGLPVEKIGFDHDGQEKLD
jgi:hypothetical protein